MYNEMEKLNEKIHEAIQVIAALREENAALKGQLREFENALRKEAGRGKLNVEAAAKIESMKEELKNLQSDRMKTRKKVRSALRKLEGIKLKGSKSDQAQQDLFGSD